MGTDIHEFVADILIAIDDEKVAVALSQILESHDGIRMIIASSEDELLNRLDKEPFDALVVSAQFHGLIYQGLVSLIRSGDLCTANLPIILVSDTDSDRYDDVEVRYFVKVLRPSDLPQTVEVIKTAIADRPRPLVLLIDDSEQFLGLIKERLDPSFRVVATTNPEEAIALVESNQPDLVVTDYAMPFHDGEEVTRTIRSRSPETPIVVFTAHATPRNHRNLAKAGITRFLSKDALPQLDQHLREIVMQRVVTRASKAAAFEASATDRLVAAIKAARTDLQVGRAAFATERLRGALIRSNRHTFEDNDGEK